MTEGTELKKKYRRRWTEQQRADALAVYDSTNNAHGTAKKMGVPLTTLRDWLADRDGAAPIELREEARKSLLETLDQARWMYLEHLMSPEVVAKESGYYAAQAFTKLNEAHQLLSGGPTARFSLADYLRGAATKIDSIEGEFKETAALPQGDSNGKHA